MADKLDTALACASPDNPVMLAGPPGVGKSARIEQWAARTGQHLLIEHPVIAQSVDYRGLPAVVDGEAQWLPLGGLKQICNPDGEPTVVLLDDVGQAPGPVQAALMQLILARKLGDLHIRDNVTFVLATNRVSDRTGVKPMLSALVNRLMIVEIEGDSKAWADWAIAQEDISPTVAAYARFRPDCFVNAVPDEPMRPYCTPRSLHAVGRLVHRGVTGLDMLAGWVGMDIAADYAAYTESIDKLPSIDELLSQPKLAKEIKDHGLLHAVAAMAARRVQDRPDDVVDLANTLGGGWGLVTMSSSAGYHPDFKRTPAFKRWALAHKDLL